MKWRGRQGSGNIEDRRRMAGGRGMALGGGGFIIMAIIYLLMGGDLGGLLQMFVQHQGQVMMEGGAAREPTPQENETAEFVSVVLADTEDVWRARFAEMGQTYQEPTLVLFAKAVKSGCGFASAQTGPFYCPLDGKVYLDLTFFDELKGQFGAPGDFAQAYVIAHEIGHHVQNLLGISQKVQAKRGRVSEEEYNRLSVMLELQADFYAGIWAHDAQRMKQILEPGDVDEAIGAASAVGDDRIQREQQGYVVPDSFTHGTSEQRIRWFRKGFESGDMEQGDTFKASRL